MTPDALTAVRTPWAVVPHQQGPDSRRLKPAVQLALPLLRGDYCSVMDDTSPWSAYIAWAVGQAGSIKELAVRSGLHRSTISDWKSGREAADTATIRSVKAIATAVGDDPRNALRAAGQPSDEAHPAAPTAVERPQGPSLAGQLEAINRRIDEISRLPLPLRDKLAAVETQRRYADQLVALFRHVPDEEPDGQQQHSA